MARSPGRLRLKSFSFNFEQVTTVASLNTCEPMTGDKITERVVLWFLVWLSKITCEVAETTRTESQRLQGRQPDLLAFLHKHPVQGGIHPWSAGSGEWH